MRISTSQIFQSSLNSMLQQQVQVARSQEQLALGKKLLKPSDDPGASATMVGLDQSLQMTRQFQDNITSAKVRMNHEESTLAATTNILGRVRELATQAGNPVLNATDRNAIAVEVRQLSEDLHSLANTAGANGEYLFAGYQGKTQPFTIDASGNTVYHGDSGQRFVQIGPSRQVAVSDAGVDVFQNISRGNGSFVVEDNHANTGTGLIGTGRLSDPAAYDQDTYTVTFAAATSASPNLVFDSAEPGLTYHLSINGTPVYSVSQSGDPAASLEALAGEINGASTTTGVRAMVADGVLYLANSPPSATPISITESLSGAVNGDADGLTGYFGSALSGDTMPEQTLSHAAGASGHYVVENSAGNVETVGAYLEGGQIAFKGIQFSIGGAPNAGDTFLVTPAGRQDLFTTVNGLVAALESSATSTSLSNSIGRFLGDVDQAMDHMSNIRARVGTRLRTLESQESLNAEQTLQVEAARSSLVDLDYASAITRFNQQMMALEAAQRSFVQAQGLSLFNYI